MNNKILTYRYIMLPCMLYCTVLQLSGIYTYKIVHIFAFTFAASSLIYPSSYAINDVVCEVYGYQQSRKLIWFGLITVFFFACVTKLLNILPSTQQFAARNACYIEVLGSYMRLSWAGLASMVVGEFTNSMLLSKWKMLLHGKHFWLRSIGSTSIGAIFDTLIEYSIAFLGLVSTTDWVKMVCIAYLFRVVYAIILSAPALLAVILLRVSEKLHFKKNKSLEDLNPFGM